MTEPVKPVPDQHISDPITLEDPHALVSGAQVRNEISTANAAAVWDLRMQGLAHDEIADRLRIPEKTVRDHCTRKLNKIVHEMANVSAPALVAQEVARIDRLWRVAFARATGGAILNPMTHEHKLDKDGNPRYYDPDPRWVARAQQLSDARAGLLGLKVKQVDVRHAHVHATAGPAADLSKLSTTEIALLEFLQRKAGIGAPKSAGLLEAPASSDGSQGADVVDAEYSLGDGAPDAYGAAESAEEGDE